MAKRKRKKETKHKVSFSTEIYSIVLILIGILGICGYGPCGKLICAFFAFLFGTLYLIPLIGLILMGVYLLFVKHYPDFFSSKIIGIVLVLIGLLIIVHMSFVTKPLETGKVVTWKEIITETFNETVRREELDVQKDGVERVTGVDNVDGNVMVDKSKNIKVKSVDVAFYL